MSRCLVLLQPFGGNPHSGFSASAREPLDPHLGSSDAVSLPCTLSGLGLGLGPEVFLPVGLRGMTLLVRGRTWVSVQQTPLPWALALCCPPPSWRVGCAQEREGMGRAVALLIILDLSPPPAPLEKGSAFLHRRHTQSRGPEFPGPEAWRDHAGRAAA